MSIRPIRSQTKSASRFTLVRSVILGAAFIGLVSACERPEIVGPARGNFIPPSQTGVGFDLVEGSFLVDGVLRSDRMNMSTDRFVYLFVFIKSKGMYIVTAEETDAGVVAGRFSGGSLIFTVEGTRVEFMSNQTHLFDDHLDRSAWVEYLPEYDLLGPDARHDDSIVGLAPRKNVIPGFVENSQ